MKWLRVLFLLPALASAQTWYNQTDVISNNAIALTNKTIDCTLNTCSNISGGLTPIVGTSVLGNSSGSTALPTAQTRPTTLGYITAGNLVSPAAPVTSGHNWFYNTNAIQGTMTGNNQFSANYWGINDSMDTTSNTGGSVNSLFFAQYSLQNNFTGLRNLRYDFLNVVGVPKTTDTTAHSYVTDQAQTSANVIVGGTALNRADAFGGLWTGVDNSFLNSGATNWLDVFGREIDFGLSTGSSSTRGMGLDIVLDTLAAVKPTLEYTALHFGSKPAATAFWGYGVEFGGPVNLWPFDSSSTLIGASQQQIPVTVSAPTANYGIDWRAVTFTTGAEAYPNAGTDQNGNVYGGNLYTGGSITSQTASIASIAASAYGGVTGGAYFASTLIPTIAISAPPNSGTQAAATVATMKLTQALLVAGTDVGCSNNDVLTLTGGTGTQATLTLTVSGGVVTAVAITTAGSYTALSATPGTTGGTCSVQPALNLGYGIATVTVGTAGTNYPAYPLPYIVVTGGNNSRNTPAILTATMSTANAALSIASTTIKYGGTVLISSTAPTIASGFNTSGFSITAVNTAAFQVTVGSGTGTSTGVLTMPTATTGWACSAADVTTPATHAIQQTASGTTSVTVTDYSRTAGTAQNMANGDKIVFHCGAF